MKRSRAHLAASAGSIAFTAVLLSFTLVLLATTLDLPPSAAIVPRVVAISLALLLSYALLNEIRLLLQQKKRETTARQPREIGSSDADGDDVPEPVRSGGTHELVAILWVLALPAIATLLGFVAGPALYVFGWTRFRAGERMVVAVSSAASTAVLIWMLFSVLLGVHLPHGVLDYLTRAVVKWPAAWM